MSQVTEPTTAAGTEEARKRALLSSLVKRQTASKLTVAKRSDPGRASLSLTQQKLWLLQTVDPSDTSYNESVAFHVGRDLSEAHMAEALAALVQRHETLRTTIALQDGEPVQIIHPPFRPDVMVVECGDVQTDERDAAVRRTVAAQEAQPFDLAALPLFRVAVLRFGAENASLALTFHHIHIDTWSVPILMRELLELYAASEQGRPASLSPVRMQYGDFSDWQRQWYAGTEERRQLDHWCRHLSGDLPALELEGDFPRRARPSYRGATASFALDRASAARAGALASRLGVTSFVLLLAGVYVWLHRATGQGDFVVGCPVANRRLRETENLIGFFANTLALRAPVSSDQSFADVVRHVRDVVLDGFDHQDAPFESLVESLAVERDPSRNPVFQVLFNYESAWADNKSYVDQAGIKPIEIQKDRSKFDLSFYIGESDGVIEGMIQYSTDLFGTETGRRIADGFVRVLTAAIAQPDIAVGRLAFLSEENRREIVEDWNRTDKHYLSEPTLHGAIERQAAATAAAVACRFGDERLSYGELNRRADAVARAVKRGGAVIDGLVGVSAQRSIDLIPILLGIMKAGSAYVPLDPAQPAERLKAMVDDAGIRMAVVDEKGAAAVDGLVGTVIPVSDALRGAASDVGGAAPNVRPDNLAYVLFTSGSTGRPKASMIAHRAIVNRLAWMQDAYRLGPDDIVLQKTALSFDVSVWEIFWPLTVGASVFLAEPNRQGDADYVWRSIAEHGITTAHFVPSMLPPFLDSKPNGDATSLRRVVCSGEALPRTAVRSFERVLPSAVLNNLYGPTEAAVDVTAWTCRPDDGDAAPPIGRPIANVQIFILDDRMEPVPVGVRGDLHIGGVALARGYAGAPGLTAERFVPNPFRSGERLYRTGDKAKYGSDGRIFFLGRSDAQVKLRGFRIELGDVEAALMAGGRLAQAAVVVRDDGQGGRRLVAYVVPGRGLDAAMPDGEEPLPAALQSELGRRLPSYMIPSAFHIMERLPVTTSGKLDVKALPSPDMARRPYAAPSTPTEMALDRVWRPMLRLDRIGIHDNYFELGGDSIRAIRLATEARRAGVPFSVQQLFEHQTIAALAAALDRGGPSVVTTEDPASSAGAEIPGGRRTFANFDDPRIEALYRDDAGVMSVMPVAPSPKDLIAQWRSTGRPEINLVQTIGYSADLDRGILERVFDLMVSANPVLRTSYAWQNLPEPVQCVHAAGRVPVAYEDWRGLTEQECRDRARDVLKRDGRRGAEPHSPSPWRVFLGQVNDRDYVTIQTFNYISLDGWSMLTVGREMMALYRDILQGRPAVPAVRPDYGSFISWVRSSDREAARTFWRRELEGHDRFGLASAVARRGGTGQDGYESKGIRLPSGLTQGVRDSLRAQQITEGLFYLAAWSILVSYLTGRADLVLGVVITGRTPEVPDIQDMIGYTMNYQPLRLSLHGHNPVRSVFAQIKEKSIELMSYERTSISDIKEWCGYGDHELVFDSLFYFQNIGGYFLDGFSQTINQRRPLAYSRTAYPMRFDIFPTSAEIGNQVFAGYETSVYAAQDVDRLLQTYADTVTYMQREPNAEIAQVFDELARLEATPDARRTPIEVDDSGDRLW